MVFVVLHIYLRIFSQFDMDRAPSLSRGSGVDRMLASTALRQAQAPQSAGFVSLFQKLDRKRNVNYNYGALIHTRFRMKIRMDIPLIKPDVTGAM